LALSSPVPRAALWRARDGPVGGKGAAVDPTADATATDVRVTVGDGGQAAGEAAAGFGAGIDAAAGSNSAIPGAEEALVVTKTKEETTRGSLDSLVLTKESKTEERRKQ
jgi:hypothetical protein